MNPSGHARRERADTVVGLADMATLPDLHRSADDVSVRAAVRARATVIAFSLGASIATTAVLATMLGLAR
ncbi:hypothetical protein [Actinopolymorpha sp. B9G3]|uniref:hypothetical protein n=1 Tax=Actinopolymorpha sp. B9G3 TaxID=3158970 RepID=UPI0032D98544